MLYYHKTLKCFVVIQQSCNNYKKKLNKNIKHIHHTKNQFTQEVHILFNINRSESIHYSHVTICLYYINRYQTTNHLNLIQLPC